MRMTENEAIIEIEKDLKLHSKDLSAKYKKVLRIAIQALERQMPKKVYHFTDDDTFETSCCGTDVTNEDYKYCPECGQLLGEVEEVREYDGE